MFAVQAEGCAPIVKAYEAGEEHAPEWLDAHTFAAGIRVPKAIGDFLILRAVRESGGAALAVSDAQIEAARSCAGARTVCCCARKARRPWPPLSPLWIDGLIEPDSEMVLFNCGSGLKYPLPDPARSLDRTKPITPDMLKG
jgi:threonine synthase